MDSARILRCLNGTVRRPTELQLRLLASVSALYEREGVLPDASARSLHDCCPDAAACWAGAVHRVSREARLEGDGEDGSIFWPFIGRDYRPGGVCIVGWNINHDGTEWYGLQEEFVIAERNRERLARGVRADEHSMFAYRSLAAGTAVADSLDGKDPADDPEPTTLADGMQRIARLQAIKCVPLRDHSNPEEAMTTRCPQRYVVGELDILGPSALVILGADALNGVCDALETDDPETWIDWQRKFDGGYARGTRTSSSSEMTILGLWHPSYGGWPRCYERMIADLRQTPLPLRAAT